MALAYAAYNRSVMEPQNTFPRTTMYDKAADQQQHYLATTERSSRDQPIDRMLFVPHMQSQVPMLDGDVFWIYEALVRRVGASPDSMFPYRQGTLTLGPQYSEGPIDFELNYVSPTRRQGFDERVPRPDFPYLRDKRYLRSASALNVQDLFLAALKLFKRAWAERPSATPTVNRRFASGRLVILFKFFEGSRGSVTWEDVAGATISLLMYIRAHNRFREVESFIIREEQTLATISVEMRDSPAPLDVD